MIQFLAWQRFNSPHARRCSVTIGEALLQNARLLCLDSISAGLDAATALEVLRYITAWARHTGRCRRGARAHCVPAPDVRAHD